MLHDPGYNVAYWNLATRTRPGTGSRFMVGDRSFRLFHFSGFSPLGPHFLSRHRAHAAPIHLADQPALARLCSRYARKLLGAGYLEAQGSRLPIGLRGQRSPSTAACGTPSVLLYKRSRRCRDRPTRTGPAQAPGSVRPGRSADVLSLHAGMPPRVPGTVMCPVISRTSIRAASICRGHSPLSKGRRRPLPPNGWSGSARLEGSRASALPAALPATP